MPCGKRSICICWYNRKIKWEANYPRTVEDFDFSEALDSVYPLTEIIFDYLDYDSLKTASQVKKSWQLAADKILAKRAKISWISVIRRNWRCWLHRNEEYFNHEISAGIILFNCRRISLSDPVCLHDRGDVTKMKLLDFLSNQVVNRTVEYCMVGCPVVDSRFLNGIERNNASLFDGCFFPPIRNAKISMFYFNPEDTRKGEYLETNHELKCLLIFTRYHSKVIMYKILDELMPKSHVTKVALGGGVIQRAQLRSCDPPSRKSQIACIAFTQDINKESFFSAFSIVIEGRLESKDFENRLIQFKEEVVLRKKSMAFRFCCTAKMIKSHESRSFRKLFPDTPLLGLDAEGEIGWNTCNNAELSNGGDILGRTYAKRSGDAVVDNSLEDIVKKMLASFPKPQHQWSTVFVLITWD